MIRGHQTEILIMEKTKACPFLGIIYELCHGMIRKEKNRKHIAVALLKIDENNFDSTQLKKPNSAIWNNRAKKMFP